MIFDFLYDARYDARDYEGLELIQEYWCGPKRFPHGDKCLVARIPKRPEDGDGQPVDVYVCAMPARFYTVEAKLAEDSVGWQLHAWSLETGSGVEMAELASRMALAISSGMLCLKHPEEKDGLE